MNLKEAIEGFIVLYIALFVGAYAKHGGLLFVITVIAFIVSIFTDTLNDFSRILYMATLAVFLGTLYLYVLMTRTISGRQQIVDSTKLVKDKLKQVFS